MSTIFSWIFASQPDDARQPAYRRLYLGIRAAILDGRLKPGEKLPATRDLAKQLRISRNTIVNAFDLLMSEGYLEGRIGAGSFVAASLPDHLFHTATSNNVGKTPPASPKACSPSAPATTQRPTPATPTGSSANKSMAEGRKRPLRISKSAQRSLAFTRQHPHFPVSRPFNPAAPDLSAFPFDIWARLLRRAWRAPKPAIVTPDDSMGLADLREEIAGWLRQTRGVNCSAAQIMIVSGAQQALDFIGRALIDPGDIVALEDPGYEGIRGVLAANGAVIQPIPVDEEGLQVSALNHPQSQDNTGHQGQQAGAGADANAGMDAKAGANISPRMVVTTPSRNYPMGTTLSLARRLALLQWAHDNDGWIIEDDYDSEYRYDGPPLSSLQGLDREDRVLYVGTFSRVLFPGIRLGYLVLPHDLVPVFRGLRSFADGVPAPTAQAALAAFFADGHFGSHVRRMRLLYGDRRQHLLNLINDRASDLLDIVVNDGGLHVCARLINGQPDQKYQPALLAKQIDCRFLSSYFHDKTHSENIADRQGLIMGFAGWEKSQLEQSFGDLVRILRRNN
ncbi:PLP-dependent aminotransferase family protein [Thalassospira marina]|uniref:Transcriptional regulator n=1 Tax=Thalassospira marina TaxID=2048283 RepID=A0ABN5FG17_9PROT|nr:PLP-dependent aminotransferase family protein [Thalassospira marina]AUG53697.1 transcriptional regulator [Thalassospira marina]